MTHGDDSDTLDAALDDFLHRTVDRKHAALASGLDAESLRAAVADARARGLGEVAVVAEGGALGRDGPFSEPLRGRLHEAGLVLLGVERLLWEDGAHAASSRRERIEAETRAAVLRCALRDSPEVARKLEDEVVRLVRERELLAQLQLDHARTRDVERERSEQLARLRRLVDDEEVERLAAEVERLNGQLDEIQATRIWRMGQGYWRFRDRVRGGRSDTASEA
jgi:hypothetical protein